jgi:hypothetical protein
MSSSSFKTALCTGSCTDSFSVEKKLYIITHLTRLDMTENGIVELAYVGTGNIRLLPNKFTLPLNFNG